MTGNAEPDSAASSAAVTDAVTAAFALGWQMARLYTGQLASNAEPKLDDDLPGLSKLPAASLVTLGLAQADLGLERLGSFLGDGAQLPTTDPARVAIAAEPADRDAIRQAILDLHVRLLIDLTAGDYRLGKAYGLGRALADTCGSARSDAAARKTALAHQLERHRAMVLVGWLDDLKSVLPPHAGQAVGDSLQRWTRWAQSAGVSGFDDAAMSETSRVLHRCGQRWRALLSGEKHATDLLETDDYVSAARGVLTRAGAIGRSLARQLIVPLIGGVILIGVGLALMFLNNSTAQVLAGLGTVAGGLGVTWRSAASSLGRVSLDLGRPLWAGELDTVVGNRLTPAPQRNYAPALTRPRGRWKRAWRELASADSETPQGSPARAAASASGGDTA